MYIKNTNTYISKLEFMTSETGPICHKQKLEMVIAKTSMCRSKAKLETFSACGILISVSYTNFLKWLNWAENFDN